MDISSRQSKLVLVKFLQATWRVFRRLVWETATDNTTGLAAQMAYTLLFAAAPVLLFLWHLLGLFGTDPAKLHRMFLILKEFLPPDPKVQDILDSALASVVVTGSSGWIANAGIIAGIYLGTMFISTVSRALSHTHGVVEDRHWWFAGLRREIARIYTIQQERSFGDDDFVLEGIALASKPAAVGRGDHANVRGRHFQHFR